MLTAEREAACKAMAATDLIKVGEFLARWPQITREEEHRLLEALDRLGDLLGIPPWELWEAVGFPSPARAGDECICELEGCECDVIGGCECECSVRATLK